MLSSVGQYVFNNLLHYIKKYFFITKRFFFYLFGSYCLLKHASNITNRVDYEIVENIRFIKMYS